MPGALKNFIALIGWSPGDEREAMTEAELIGAFDLKGLQPSPGRFDLDKLKWLNGHAIRAMDPADLLDATIAFALAPYTESYWDSFAPDPEIPGHTRWIPSRLGGDCSGWLKQLGIIATTRSPP